jgi:hypothetical protein
MKVLVTYTDAPLNPEAYECPNETRAREFAADELAWENTIAVEIPDLGFKEDGSFIFFDKPGANA